jgi:hypothetical protein
MKIRASSDPVAIHCAGSIYLSNTGQVPASRGEAAELGTAAHEAIAGMIRTGEIPANSSEEIRILCYQARAVLDEIGPHLRGKWFIEQPVGDDRLTGTADLIAWDGERLCVLDWKTGRVGRDYWAQLIGYAARACLSMQIEPAEIYLAIAELRDGQISGRMATPDEVNAHIETLNKQLRKAAVYNPEADGMGIYTTGPHCGSCNAAAVCPAFAVEARALAMMAGEDFPAWETVTPQALRTIRALLAVIGRWEETFKAGLVQRIESAGGELDCGDGMLLTTERKTTRRIDTARALPLLDRWDVPTEVVQGATTLSLKPLQDWAKSMAPRGEKTAAGKRIVDELEAAGALIINVGNPYPVEKRKETER